MSSTADDTIGGPARTANAGKAGKTPPSAKTSISMTTGMSDGTGLSAGTGMGTVYFVGAGPGDPELLTIKGRNIIARAGLVLYAGSLVPPEIVACAAISARVEDSAPLTLEECHALTRETVLRGEDVARVHTGDPSLYGALREQIALLNHDGIGWRVIPGVTAACAAAAAAGVSFTVPTVTQSLIITRMEGRTPMPGRERIATFAAHKSSLAVYLSAGAVDTLQAELLLHLPPETVVICAYRVGWPEERIIRTSAGELAAAVRSHCLTRQTIFLVLPGEAQAGAPSRLYAADFSHGFRKNSTGDADDTNNADKANDSGKVCDASMTANAAGTANSAASGGLRKSGGSGRRR